MAQKPKTIYAEILSGGTRQRLVEKSAAPADRFVSSIYFEAFYGNTGKIFIGDDQVVDGIYTTALEPSQGSEWNGDQVRGTGAVFKNLIDLSEVYFDGTTGDFLMVTYSVEA